MGKWDPISLKHVKGYPLSKRNSKVNADDLGRSWTAGGSFSQWLNTLPAILAGKDLRDAAVRIARSSAAGGTVLLGMGAHVIKVGLSPILLDLMERGVITALAMNGAGIIHDTELAMVGATSEDVAAEIGSGAFGMADDTGRFINQAISFGAKGGLGLGRAVGRALVEADFPYNRFSLLAGAYNMDIPVTVHVAMGTDIIHAHPGVDPAAIGESSHLDFRIFTRLVASLEGGVFINAGSAVILPEVFLKALNLARNLGHTVRDVTTLNMDFIRHYRPMTNVIHRPTMDGGKGISLVGHHEIMIPLLAAAVIEELAGAQVDEGDGG
ncbi:MAG: hypothetical protein JRK53_17145 [Deltaproteobacteria bacterium]|nr:hypothetical protein [Deltaproteobacteria bacterium]MBW1816829.1 hypothetical protein [Deltaproteobacteria bacterium]